MITCQHDPLFTTDGRCAKCYPRKTAVMVQHIDGTQEVHPGWIVAQAVTNETAQAAGAAKIAEYATWQENAKDWRDIKGDLAL